MRAFLVSAALIALFIAMTPAVSAQSAADEAAIRQANEQRIAAYNAKDAKAYLAFFDEDCTEAWAGGPCNAAIEESGEIPANARARIIKEVGIVFITPDVALLRDVWEGSGSVDADGKPIPPRETPRASVYVKKAGRWLLATRFSQPVQD